MSVQPEPRPSPRIGDAERDDAVALLQEHLAAGRLDNAEFDERLSSALVAKTMADLEPLFLDLPGRRPALIEPPAAVPAVRGSSSADRQANVQRVGRVVVAGLWPAAILLYFAIGWHAWWIMFIPIFLSGVIAQAFGLGGSDGRSRHSGH